MSNWFGGSRGRSRGRGASRPSGRPLSQRAALQRNPLVGLELPELQQPQEEQQPSRRKKHYQRKIIGLTVPQFILVAVGALLLMGLFFGLTWYRHRGQAPGAGAPAATTKKSAQPPPRPLSAPAPGRPAYQATSPLEAVRVMVKASLSGDRDTAYGQWAIGPQEIGAFKAGQELTVAELVAIAAQRGERTALGNMQFEIREQSGNTAKVVQLHEGMIQQVYSLRRKGSAWKIANISIP